MIKNNAIKRLKKRTAFAHRRMAHHLLFPEIVATRNEKKSATNGLIVAQRRFVGNDRKVLMSFQRGGGVTRIDVAMN